ncbi:hypothetical protein Sjap_006560 [Stephania japonica]|uniref:Uncharacterized protein n=1 Tax=Stephania japonica TaxID=461633 RepID=A0AAP0K8G5_9MAGN
MVVKGIQSSTQLDQSMDACLRTAQLYFKIRDHGRYNLQGETHSCKQSDSQHG